MSRATDRRTYSPPENLRDLRMEAEGRIEALLAFLDATAPDPDLEGDEPEAGAKQDFG